MPRTCGHFRPSVNLHVSAVTPSLPRSRCTVSQLPNLKSWTPSAPPSTAPRTSLRCHSAEQASPLTLTEFLQTLQDRQPKRLSPTLLDEEGRFMLKNLTKAELLDWVALQGERPQRAHHLWRWMYYKELWIRNLKDTQGRHNGFGSAFMQHFNASATVDGGLQLQSTHRASDGTCKMLFKLKGQDAMDGLIETVLIPVAPHGKQRPRTTLCVSSQVGCAMNCQFCFTGRMGLRAQLSTAQIVEQVIEALRLASSQQREAAADANPTGSNLLPPTPAVPAVPPVPAVPAAPPLRFSSQGPAMAPDSDLTQISSLGSAPALVTPTAVPVELSRAVMPAVVTAPALPPITNIVFMGMGEPLHNLAAVMSAVDILCDPTGLQFSHNKVTVSTVGLVPQLREFVNNSPAQLAVSLHATTDEVREAIVPVNRKWPLSSLIAALQELFPRSRSRNSHARHVLIEYVMLAGVNDSLEDAHRLVELMHAVECKINLIVFNPHVGTCFVASSLGQVEAFRAIIVQAQRVCTIRDSRGDDEMAACGQLGNLQASP